MSKTCLAVLAVIASLLAGAAPAAWPPESVELSRPRTLYRSADLDEIRARLDRDPYRTLLARLNDTTEQRFDLGDHSIVAERTKAQIAKASAFLFALDRKLEGGGIVALSASERIAHGDRARLLLSAMFTHSRIPAQFDDDINTSEELLQYVTAYDTLAGSGYDLGEDEAVIRANLLALTSEFFTHYTIPEAQGGLKETADLLTNNHLSKSAAAIGMAALVLAEYEPPMGSDPLGVANPENWIRWATDRLDLVLRWTYTTSDGGYAEGPFYVRYSALNHLPFLRALDRFTDGAGFQLDTALGAAANLWRHPQFALTQRWMVDLRTPLGDLVPIDDGNPTVPYYGGMLSTLPDAAALHWAWLNAFGQGHPQDPPEHFPSTGEIDLTADLLCAYDDRIAAAEPPWSPTRFYPQGGNAILRSNWSADAVQVVVQAEHGAAHSFPRDRSGLGIPGSAAHEHPDPGSFLLYAFGEPLALDSGYINFGNRFLVNQPSNHNLILVDGQGPTEPNGASIRWRFTGLDKPPPVDGEAYMSNMLDSDFVDAVHVRTRYDKRVRRTDIERRFVFIDNRYLVIRDCVDGHRTVHNFTWLLHGNGGGSSGGTFALGESGGMWERPKARLVSAIAFDAGPPQFEVAEATHEYPRRGVVTHSVLRASARAEAVCALQVLVPSHMATLPPQVSADKVDGVLSVRVVERESERTLVAVWQPDNRRIYLAGPSGGYHTDGKLAVLTTSYDAPVSFYVEEAHSIGEGGLGLQSETPQTMALHTGDEGLDLLLPPMAQNVSIVGVPPAVDGACGYTPRSAESVLTLNRERRIRIRNQAGNSIPAADAGADRIVSLGEFVQLDGSQSCDFDGDELTARWQLVEAPPGSDWSLIDADTLRPSFHAKVHGRYRIALTVTDTKGAHSPESEVAVTVVERRCPADCSYDSHTDFDDLVSVVQLALGETPLAGCQSADVDENRIVSVEDAILALSPASAECRGR